LFTVHNNDYEEPLPKPQLPNRPCPTIYKVPDDAEPVTSGSGNNDNHYVEIGAKTNVNLPLPSNVLKSQNYYNTF